MWNFSGWIWPDWENTAWADMAGLRGNLEPQKLNFDVSPKAELDLQPREKNFSYLFVPEPEEVRIVTRVTNKAPFEEADVNDG